MAPLGGASASTRSASTRASTNGGRVAGAYPVAPSQQSQSSDQDKENTSFPSSGSNGSGNGKNNGVRRKRFPLTKSEDVPNKQYMVLQSSPSATSWSETNLNLNNKNNSNNTHTHTYTVTPSQRFNGKLASAFARTKLARRNSGLRPPRREGNSISPAPSASTRKSTSQTKSQTNSTRAPPPPPVTSSSPSPTLSQSTSSLSTSSLSSCNTSNNGDPSTPTSSSAPSPASFQFGSAQEAMAVAGKYVRLRQFTKALAIFEQIIDWNTGADPQLQATTWHNIGLIHSRCGQQSQALKAFQASIQIAQDNAVDTDSSGGVATSLIQMGILYTTGTGRTTTNNTGRNFGEAILVLSQALQIRLKLYGLYHPLTAKVHTHIAVTSLQMGCRNDAHKELQHVLNIQRTIVGKFDSCGVGSGSGEQEALCTQFGINHNQAKLDVASTLCNVGVLLLEPMTAADNQGDGTISLAQAKEAASLLKEAYKTQFQLLGGTADSSNTSSNPHSPHPLLQKTQENLHLAMEAMAKADERENANAGGKKSSNDLDGMIASNNNADDFWNSNDGNANNADGNDDNDELNTTMSSIESFDAAFDSESAIGMSNANNVNNSILNMSAVDGSGGGDANADYEVDDEGRPLHTVAELRRQSSKEGNITMFPELLLLSHSPKEEDEEASTASSTLHHKVDDNDEAQARQNSNSPTTIHIVNESTTPQHLETTSKKSYLLRKLARKQRQQQQVQQVKVMEKEQTAKAEPKVSKATHYELCTHTTTATTALHSSLRSSHSSVFSTRSMDSSIVSATSTTDGSLGSANTNITNTSNASLATSAIMCTAKATPLSRATTQSSASSSMISIIGESPEVMPLLERPHELEFQCDASERAVASVHHQQAQAPVISRAMLANPQTHLALIHQAAQLALRNHKYDHSLYFFEHLAKYYLHNDPSATLVGQTYHNMGVVLHASGDWQDATDCFLKAANHRRLHLGNKHHPDVATSLVKASISKLALLKQQHQHHSNRGIAFRQGARSSACPEDCLKLLQDALGIRRKCFGDVHPLTAKVLNNMGCVYMEWHKLPQAQAAFQSALDIQRAVATDNEGNDDGNNDTATDPDCPSTDPTTQIMTAISVTLCNLAYVLKQRKMYAKCATTYREALTIQEHVLQLPAYPTLSATLYGLADAEARRHEDYLALKHYTRILQLLPSSDGDNDGDDNGDSTSTSSTPSPVLFSSLEMDEHCAYIFTKCGKLHARQRDYESSLINLRMAFSIRTKCVRRLKEQLQLQKEQQEECDQTNHVAATSTTATTITIKQEQDLCDQLQRQMERLDTVLVAARAPTSLPMTRNTTTKTKQEQSSRRVSSYQYKHESRRSSSAARHQNDNGNINNVNVNNDSHAHAHARANVGSSTARSSYEYKQNTSTRPSTSSTSSRSSHQSTSSQSSGDGSRSSGKYSF